MTSFPRPASDREPVSPSMLNSGQRVRILYPLNASKVVAWDRLLACHNGVDRLEAYPTYFRTMLSEINRRDRPGVLADESVGASGFRSEPMFLSLADPKPRPTSKPLLDILFSLRCLGKPTCWFDANTQIIR